MITMYSCMIRILSGQTEGSIKPDRPMRPDRIGTSATGPGQGEIAGIYIGGVNQIMCAIDTWELSHVRISAEMAEFMRVHNLVGKSWDAIDDYLEEHDLVSPSLLRLILPTINAKTELKIVGNFPVDITLSITGSAFNTKDLP